MTKTTESKITRDDLERKLRAFQGEVKGKVDDKKSNLMAAGAGLGTLLLMIFFLLGAAVARRRRRWSRSAGSDWTQMALDPARAFDRRWSSAARRCYDGLFGPSSSGRRWRWCVFGRTTLKKMFGKNKEMLGSRQARGPGHTMQISDPAALGAARGRKPMIVTASLRATRRARSRSTAAARPRAARRAGAEPRVAPRHPQRHTGAG